jgi:hypothetical protein
MTERADFSAEDWEFPDASDMDPAEAAALWDEIERQSREANKLAKRLKERKATAKELAIKTLEASPYTSVRIEGAEGREVQVTPYAWTVYTVKDEAAFKEWAAGEAERYYDGEPRLREQLFLDEMRRREADKEPLPPGVTSWTDTKISRTTVPQRRGRPVAAPGAEQGPVD